MNSPVCIDANIAIKLVVEEEGSENARALWEEWGKSRAELIAPTLWSYEITAAIRRKIYRGLLTPEEGEEALEAALGLPVMLLKPSHRRALILAEELNRPTAYDAHYLALAEALECEFWTVDEHLYNSVKETLPWVKLLGVDESDEHELR